MDYFREENTTEETMAAEGGVEPVKAVRKGLSGLGWRYLIGSLVIYAVQLSVIGLVRVLQPEWMENATISLIISVMPMYLVGMPVMIAVIRQMPGQAPERHKMKAGQFLVSLILCFTLMYCGNLLGTLVTTVIGLLKGSAVNNTILGIATTSNMAVNFIYMVLCAPILEEYLFRKLIVDRTVQYGQGVAVVLSGLMFGLFHGNLNQFAYAFLMGMFLAFLYVKTGNLKITIGLHMCINFVGAVVSVLILKGIHLEEYQEILMNGADSQQIMGFVMQYLPGWIAYMIYLVLVLAAVITGIVLFLVFRKRFVLGEGVIPKGKRFAAVIGNPGMLLYCLFWVVMIVMQLFL